MELSWKVGSAEHSKLRVKSTHGIFGKKLYQLSSVDFPFPMGIESLWFEYRDMFPELFLSYGLFCATSSEKMENGLKLPKEAENGFF